MKIKISLIIVMFLLLSAFSFAYNVDDMDLIIGEKDFYVEYGETKALDFNDDGFIDYIITVVLDEYGVARLNSEKVNIEIVKIDEVQDIEQNVNFISAKQYFDSNPDFTALDSMPDTVYDDLWGETYLGVGDYFDWIYKKNYYLNLPEANIVKVAGTYLDDYKFKNSLIFDFDSLDQNEWKSVGINRVGSFTFNVDHYIGTDIIWQDEITQLENEYSGSSDLEVRLGMLDTDKPTIKFRKILLGPVEYKKDKDIGYSNIEGGNCDISRLDFNYPQINQVEGIIVYQNDCGDDTYIEIQIFQRSDDLFIENILDYRKQPSAGPLGDLDYKKDLDERLEIMQLLLNNLKVEDVVTRRSMPTYDPEEIIKKYNLKNYLEYNYIFG
ncbi:hypothetical protein ACFL1H_05920 [Nanoarchaeota archaeon]